MTTYRQDQVCLRCYQLWNGWGTVCNQCKTIDAINNKNAAEASRSPASLPDPELRAINDAYRVKESPAESLIGQPGAYSKTSPEELLEWLERTRVVGEERARINRRDNRIAFGIAVIIGLIVAAFLI